MASRATTGTDTNRFTLVTHVVRRGDGQGRVNLEIVKEALRKGYRITLIADEIAPELQDDPGIKWIRVSAKGLPSQLLKELVFSFRSARAIRRHQDGPLLSNGCITSVPAKVNACHFVHASWLASSVHTSRITPGLRGRYQKLYSVVNARLEKHAYLASETVVAVSDQVKKELTAIGIPAAKVVTIHNGVDTREFAPGPTDRAKFGLPESIPLALFAGDIRSPRKNLDTVLKALAQAPGLHLAVAGATEGSPFPELAAKLGVSDRTHFLGNIREMPLLMRSCDLFVFPSRYEACSLVMLEAMSSGLPVVTARTTGGAELVPDDGGFLMDSPDAPSALSEILRHAVSNPQGLATRSARSREQALGLGWETMAARYLELLSEPSVLA